MQVVKNTTWRFKAVGLCFVASSLGIIGMLSLVNSLGASALSAEQSVDFQFTFNPSLSVSLSAAELVIEDLMPGNYANSNTIAINVETNNRNGYTLTAEVGDSETASLANSNLVNAATNATFTSLASSDNLTLNNFTPNYWGYTVSNDINSSTTYSGLLYGTTTTINQTVDTTGKSVGNYYGGNATSFTIGASAGVGQISGAYTNTISFAIVPNVSTDVVIDSLKYLQDFAKLNQDQRSSTMNSMTAEQQYTLNDQRDNKEYTITKLSNGTVWMTKNLDLAGGTTLTPALSNVAADYTLPASSETGFSDDTVAYVYNSNSTTCGDNSPCYSYYSYVAATAGTNPSSGDSLYDICPKGWRLPTSTEYSALITAYTTGDTLTASPWNGTYSGTYLNSALNNGGINGNYSASTTYDASSAYRLSFNSSSADVYYNNKKVGRSIRCILESTTIHDVIAMQDFVDLTPVQRENVLNSMYPELQYTLKDARDNQDYTITKLQNGTVWMTKNLNIAGGTQLTPADSNVTSNYTLPASSTTGFDDNTVANLYNSNSTTCGDNSPCYSYYNYITATAGTNPSSGNASQDICPKGWRLPTDTEFTTLTSIYQTGDELTVAPWYGVYAGYYGTSAFSSGGSLARYWASTANSASSAYHLRFENSGSSVQYDNKYYGRSVRCVLDPPAKTYTILYNKNTTDTVSNMPSTQTGALNSVQTTVTLSSATPTRTNYNFLGWCSVQPTTSNNTDSCSGTTYAAGSQYSLGSTSQSNTTVNLYAMWKIAKLYLQSVTSSTCTTTAKTAYDNRDEEAYTIQKLADGKCWLLDNLRLDLSNSTVKSKTTSSTTNASDATLNYLKGTSTGTASNKYAMRGVTTTWGSSYRYSEPRIYTSSKNNTQSYGSGSGKIGIYYNYCAATAGSYCYGNTGTGYGSPSGNATEDICPKGWRLPNGGSGSSSEYQALYTAYSSNYTNFKNALRTPVSGNVSYSGSVSNAGSYGYFWSATAYSTSGVYSLIVQTGSATPGSSGGRMNGYSVRCILK